MAKTVQVALASATRDQLVAFAQRNLGMELAKNISAEAARAKIRQVFQGDMINVPEDEIETVGLAQPTSPEAERAAFSPHRGKDPDELLTIMISGTDAPGGNEPVYVGVNGIGLYIPRGKPCRVRRKYVEALDNAVIWRYVVDEKNITVPEPVPTPAYPVSLMSAPAA